MDSHDRRVRQGNVSSFAGGQASGQALPTLGQQLPDVQTGAQYPSVSDDRFQVRGSVSAAVPTGRSVNMPPFAYPGSPQYPGLPTGQPLQAQSMQYAQSAATDFTGGADTSHRVQQQTPQQRPAHARQQAAQHQSPQQHTPQQFHNIYGPQASPPTPYDAVQQYPARQSAAIEVLTNQFAGVPQAYYVGDDGPTSDPSAGLASQGVQQPSYNPYAPTHSPVARDSLSASYNAPMPDLPAGGNVAAQHSYDGQLAYDTPASNPVGTITQYQEALKRAYTLMRDGDMNEAASAVLSLSEWLLGNAEHLDLTRDDESARAARLKLWHDFNTCWVALLQRQKDLTNEWSNAGQRVDQVHRLIQSELMESMGKELVRLCDGMEKHGLVDYQMGVWEEEILELLTSCLDMLSDEQQASAAIGVATTVPRRR